MNMNFEAKIFTAHYLVVCDHESSTLQILW